jgi:hypothetical protein
MPEKLGLDRMIEAANTPPRTGFMIYHRPNTISITFDIQGWAKGGQIEKVEVLLD